ncbi:MAG: MgtC/SapB family protein [Chloroflexota bacterium]
MHVATISWQEVLARLGLALVLGSLVGLERERRDRAAGLRTHALVCLGSALIMLVSAYGLLNLTADSRVSLDPSRIAAQVVSGIGFLGAGTIIFRREIVRGLTTAAGLWVVAGVGLAVGSGLYLAAVGTTVGALLVLAAFTRIEARFFRRPQVLTVHVHPEAGQLPAIRHVFQKNQSAIRRMIIRSSGTGGESITVEYVPASDTNMETLVDDLRAVSGFQAIEQVTVIPDEEDENDELSGSGV